MLRSATWLALAPVLLLLGGPLSAQELRQLSALRDSGKVAAFDSVLDAALRAHPSDPAFQLVAAEIRLLRGQTAEGMAFARQVLAGPSRDTMILVDAHLKLARGAFLLGDTAQARARLQSAAAFGGRAQESARSLTALLGLDPAYVGWTVLESEHLRAHFPADTRLTDPGAWLRDREAAFREVQSLLPGPLPKKLDVFVWNSSADAQRIGLPPLGFTRSSFVVTHVRIGQSRGHEFAHALAYWTAPDGRGTALILEGTGAYLDLNRTDRLENARQAMRASGINGIAIAAVWDRPRLPEPVLYTVGALVVQRLVERGGPERFRALLRDQTLESARRIYGDLLQQVIADTEKDLNAT